MQLQDIFLDKTYLETRLRDFKEIKNGQITYRFVDSNRENSKSVYIEFFNFGNKGHTLRISDHKANTPHTQFIVDTKSCANSKKKEMLMRTIKNCITKCCANTVKYYYKKIRSEENERH